MRAILRGFAIAFMVLVSLLLGMMTAAAQNLRESGIQVSLHSDLNTADAEQLLGQFVQTLYTEIETGLREAADSDQLAAWMSKAKQAVHSCLPMGLKESGGLLSWINRLIGSTAADKALQIVDDCFAQIREIIKNSHLFWTVPMIS